MVKAALPPKHEELVASGPLRRGHSDALLYKLWKLGTRLLKKSVILEGEWEEE